MKRVLLVTMLFVAGLGNAQASCHQGWKFDIYDVTKEYLLQGDLADMFVGSNSLPAGTVLYWQWTSYTEGKTPRNQPRSMNSCPWGTLCYAAGYSTYGYDRQKPGRSEWVISANYYDRYGWLDTCRSYDFNVQSSPTASISSISGTREAGETLSFSGSGSIDQFAKNSSLRYHWKFGDGATAQGKNVTHAYNSGGTYTAKLRTYDGNYYSAWTSKSISISGSGGGTRPPEYCGPGTPYQCK